MKNLLTLALAAVVAVGANAEEKKDSVNKNKPVFTVVKENKITSIKDQNNSGTCWAFSTLSFFESEILKKTGKTYDLSENYVASKTYMDRAMPRLKRHVQRYDCRTYAWRYFILTGRFWLRSTLLRYQLRPLP